MKIDFNESDLLKEILNFKIANKKYLLEKYGFKNIKNINEFLREHNTGIIHTSKNYLYYFGKYDENIFKIEDKDINLKRAFRRDLISFILLFGKEKLNIYNFNKKIKKSQENKGNIQNDLKQVLKIFNIKYSEYEKSENIGKLFEEKIPDFKKFKEKYLKEVLCRRLEKIYVGKSTYQENLYFNILQEILKIRNIKYIHKLIFSYIKEYTDIISIDEKYKLLVYFLLNFKNEDIKYRYTLLKDAKNENFFAIMEKIYKREKLEINSKFIAMFHKKLHKTGDNAENIINKINKELYLQNNTDLKTKKSLELEQDKIEVYDIAETSVNFEDEELLNKQIVKQYVDSNEIVKISTLVLFDLEEAEILKTYNKIKKFFYFINIVKIEQLDKFKKIITRNKNIGEFEQILLISSSKFVNVIKNFSEIPIYYLEIENKKGALKNRSSFLMQMIRLRTMMLQYLEFKQEREIVRKRIKNKNK